MSAVSSGISPADFRPVERASGDAGDLAAVVVVLAGCVASAAAQPARNRLLYLIAALALFTVAGPWIWRVDPAAQDVDQVSLGPSLPATAIIVEPYTAWAGVSAEHSGMSAGAVPDDLRLAEPPTTQAVRLVWNAVSGAGGYHVYRNLYDPEPDRALGLPIGEIVNPTRVSFEDRFDLEERATGTRLSRSIGTALKRPTTRCSRWTSSASRAPKRLSRWGGLRMLALSRSATRSACLIIRSARITSAATCSRG